MLLIFSLIPKYLDCYNAYNEYLDFYNISQVVDPIKFQNFCSNYKQFLKIKSTCPKCIVTNIFDRDIGQMKGLTQFGKKVNNGDYNCQQIYCYTDDPLPTLSNLPDQVDLRESGLVTSGKDQKECGSCWAFATTTLLENAVLRDQKEIKTQTFAKNAKELDLSDQFLLSNTFGFSNYCDGGDGVTALNFMIDNPDIWPTIETEENYPYDQRGNQANFNRQIPLPPKLVQDQFYLPYKFFDRNYYKPSEGTPKTPVVSLLNTNQFMDQDKVQQYLARGMAVLTTINTETSPTSSMILSSYDGSYVLDGFPCKGYSDHQVVIVGYGTFKEIPVWVVKNSWGSSWGNQGSMYIARGTNQFCVEEYAYAIIPKNYNPDDGIFTEKYDTPYVFDEYHPGLDKSIIIDDGNDDDDNDDTDNDEKTKKLNIFQIVVILAFILAGIVVLALVTAIIVKVRKSRQPKEINVVQFQ